MERQLRRQRDPIWLGPGEDDSSLGDVSGTGTLDLQMGRVEVQSSSRQAESEM